MPRPWQRYLQRWVEAGLIGREVADRIQALEVARDRQSGHRWPVILAWTFGALMVCAGVLLFVAAHWDQMAPAFRFSVVLLMVGLFHLAGAMSGERIPVLAQVLHAIGTVTLGAGIFLAGQIFHLQEHWPGGFMLWTAGAWFAWLVLRSPIQLGLAAILTPIWLIGEWFVATTGMTGNILLPAAGLWLLSLTYFTARSRDLEGPVRRILTWLGGIALIPATLWLVVGGGMGRDGGEEVPAGLRIIGWTMALAGPLLWAFLLRRLDAWPVAVGVGWVLLLARAARYVEWRGPDDAVPDLDAITIYILCALASCLLALWGLKDARRERINLGVLGFGLTLLFFYFGSVMDRMGRSLSLLVLGALFLVGGYFLERARRKLISRMESAPA